MNTEHVLNFPVHLIYYKTLISCYSSWRLYFVNVVKEIGHSLCSGGESFFCSGHEAVFCPGDESVLYSGDESIFWSGDETLLFSYSGDEVVSALV